MLRFFSTKSRRTAKFCALLLLAILCLSMAACAQTKVQGQYDVSVGGVKKP